MRSLDISNGEGTGVALFVQGCPFRCHNCFNAETWDFNSGKEWALEAENQFIELASKPYISRVSILGGEPLADENLEDVLKLVNKIRLLLPDKTIWLYTGYLWRDLMKNDLRKAIVSQCDIVVDGQYIESLRDTTLEWRGSSNQRVIDVQETLKSNSLILKDK